MSDLIQEDHMHKTIASFLEEYPLETLGMLTAATAGLRYYRHCTEVLNEEPLSRDEFRAEMYKAGAEFA